MGRAAKTHLPLGLRFDRRLAAFVLHTPVSDTGALGIPSPAVCAVCGGISGNSEQSPDLNPLGHCSRGHVLFHLPYSLRSDFCRRTRYEEDRPAVAEPGVSCTSVCISRDCHRSRLRSLLCAAGKAMHAARLAEEGVGLDLRISSGT